MAINYFKNVLKSTAYVAADMANELAPSIGEFIDKNSSFLKQTWSTFKSPRHATKRMIDAISNSKIFEAVGYTFHNALSDLASGNWYNKQRDDQQASETMKAMGFEDFDFDEDTSEENFEAEIQKAMQENGGNDTITAGDRLVTDAINGGIAASTSSVVNSIISTHNRAMGFTRASTALTMNQNERLISGLHTDMANVAGILKNMNDYLFSGISNIDKNLSAFQTEAIRLDTERNELLKELVDINKAAIKTAYESDNEGEASEQTKLSRYSDISSSGLPDFDRYIEMVKDNFTRTISDMTMGTDSIADMIKAAVGANPIGEAFKSITKSLIPEDLKASVESLDKSISGIWGNVIRDINKAAYNSYGPLSLLLDLFKTDTDVHRVVNTGSYTKGPVALDGIMRRSIVNVIPMQLARIESALTGNPIMIYDYDEGKWISKKAIETEYLNTIHDSMVNDAFYDFIDGVTDIFNKKLNEVLPNNRGQTLEELRERESYFNAFNDLMKTMYKTIENKGSFDLENPVDTSVVKMDDYPFLKDHMDFFKDILQQYHDEGKDANTTLLQLTGNIFNAIDRENEIFKQISSDSNTVIYAINEYNKEMRNAIFGKGPSGTVGSVGGLLGGKDKYGYGILEYQRMIWKELRYANTYCCNGRAGFGGGGLSKLTPESRDRVIQYLIDGMSDKYTTDAIEAQRKANNSEYDRLRIYAPDQSVTLSDSETTEAKQASLLIRINQGNIKSLLDINEFLDTDLDACNFLIKISKMKLPDIKKLYTDIVLSNESFRGFIFNEKNFERFKDEHFKEAHITNVANLVEACRRARASNGEKSTNEVLTEEDTIAGKVASKIGFTSLKKMISEGTVSFVDKSVSTINSVNTLLYETFFAHKFKDDDGNTYNGILDFLGAKINKTFSDIIDPIKKALGIDDDFEDRFKGAITDIGNAAISRGKEAVGRVYGGPLSNWMSGSGFGRTILNSFASNTFDKMIANDMSNKLFESLSESQKADYRERRNKSYNTTTKAISDEKDLIKRLKDLNIADETIENIAPPVPDEAYLTSAQKAQRLRDLNLLYSNLMMKAGRRDWAKSIGFDSDKSVDERIEILGSFRKNEEDRNKYLERIKNDIAKLTTNEEIEQYLIDKRYDIDVARTKSRGRAKGTFGLPFSGESILSRGEMLINAANGNIGFVPKTGLYDAGRDAYHVLNTKDTNTLLSASGIQSPFGSKSVFKAMDEESLVASKLQRHAEGTTSTSDTSEKSVIDEFQDKSLEAIEKVKSYVSLAWDKVNKNELVNAGVSSLREKFPEILAGGTVGAGVSLLLGVVGGPLVGGAIGAAASLVAHSQTLQNILFGKLDASGERTGGLISKKLQDTVKKYAPDMIDFGIAGGLSSLLLPFGPITGILLGGAIGYLKQNDDLRKRIFGKLGLTGTNDDIKQIKRLLPSATKGAILGGVASLFFGPFGILGGSVIGSAIGMMSSTEEFKRLIFGVKDSKGKRRGGLLPALDDAFKPLRDAGHEFKDRILNSVDMNIIAPMKDFLRPTIHAIPKIAAYIPKKLNQWLEKGFGMGVDTVIKRYLINPITRLFKPVAKWTGKLFHGITYPLRLFGVAGRKMTKSNIRNLDAGYMGSAKDRLSWMGKQGIEVGDNNIDALLATMDKDNLKNIQKSLSSVIKARNELNADRLSLNRDIMDKLISFRSKNGDKIDEKTMAQVKRAINNGHVEAIPKILNDAMLFNTNRTLTKNEYESLVKSGSEDGTDLMTQISKYKALDTKYNEVINNNELNEVFKNVDLGNANLNNLEYLNRLNNYFTQEIEERNKTEEKAEEVREEHLEATKGMEKTVNKIASLLERIADNYDNILDNGGWENEESVSRNTEGHISRMRINDQIVQRDQKKRVIRNTSLSTSQKIGSLLTGHPVDPMFMRALRNLVTSDEDLLDDASAEFIGESKFTRGKELYKLLKDPKNLSMIERFFAIATEQGIKLPTNVFKAIIELGPKGYQNIISIFSNEGIIKLLRERCNNEIPMAFVDYFRYHGGGVKEIQRLGDAYLAYSRGTADVAQKAFLDDFFNAGKVDKIAPSSNARGTIRLLARVTHRRRQPLSNEERDRINKRVESQIERRTKAKKEGPKINPEILSRLTIPELLSRFGSSGTPILTGDNVFGNVDMLKMYSDKDLKGYKYADIYGDIGRDMHSKGMLGKLFTSSLMDWTRRNKTVNKVLYGVLGNEDENVGAKRFLATVVGAKLGTYVGGPFGILGGALIGGALGFMSTTNAFKDAIIGKKGPDGYRHGGLIPTIGKYLIQPIKDIGFSLTSTVGSLSKAWLWDSWNLPKFRSIKSWGGVRNWGKYAFAEDISKGGEKPSSSFDSLKQAYSNINNAQENKESLNAGKSQLAETIDAALDNATKYFKGDTKEGKSSIFAALLNATKATSRNIARYFGKGMSKFASILSGGVKLVTSPLVFLSSQIAKLPAWRFNKTMGKDTMGMSYNEYAEFSKRNNLKPNERLSNLAKAESGNIEYINKYTDINKAIKDIIGDENALQNETRNIRTTVIDDVEKKLKLSDEDMRESIVKYITDQLISEKSDDFFDKDGKFRSVADINETIKEHLKDSKFKDKIVDANGKELNNDDTRAINEYFKSNGFFNLLNQLMESHNNIASIKSKQVDFRNMNKSGEVPDILADLISKHKDEFEAMGITDASKLNKTTLQNIVEAQEKAIQVGQQTVNAAIFTLAQHAPEISDIKGAINVLKKDGFTLTDDTVEQIWNKFRESLNERLKENKEVVEKERKDTVDEMVEAINKATANTNTILEKQTESTESIKESTENIDETIKQLLASIQSGKSYEDIMLEKIDTIIGNTSTLDQSINRINESITDGVSQLSKLNISIGSKISYESQFNTLNDNISAILEIMRTPVQVETPAVSPVSEMAPMPSFIASDTKDSRSGKSTIIPIMSPKGEYLGYKFVSKSTGKTTKTVNFDKPYNQAEYLEAIKGHAKGTLPRFGLGSFLLGGLSNLFGGDKSEDEDTGTTIQVVQQPQGESSTSVASASTSDSQIDKDNDGRIRTTMSDGTTVWSKVRSDGSVTLDTTDNTTAHWKNEQEKAKEEEKKRNKLQDAANKALYGAFNIGKQAVKSAKDGGGWLSNLLLGGLLLKSGALDTLWTNVVKPAIDMFTPIVKDAALAAGKYIVEKLPSALGWIKDKISNLADSIYKGLGFGKNNNSGTTTYYNTNSLDGTYKDKNNKILTNKEANDLVEKAKQNGTVPEIYNMQGEQVIFDNNGKPIIKDSSTPIDEVKSRSLELGARSIINPKMTNAAANLLVGTGNMINKGLSILGKPGKFLGEVIADAAYIPSSIMNFGARIRGKTLTTVGKPGIIQKIINKIPEWIKSFLNLEPVKEAIKKICTFIHFDSIAQKWDKLVDKFVEVFTKFVTGGAEKVTAAELSTAVGKIVNGIGWALIVSDFAIGYDQAEALLGIDNPTVFDEFMSGTINALGNFLVLPAAFGIDNCIDLLYKYIGGFFKDGLYEELEVQREITKQKVDKFNNENGTTLSVYEYLKRAKSVSGSASEYISDWNKVGAFTAQMNSDTIRDFEVTESGDLKRGALLTNTIRALSDESNLKISINDIDKVNEKIDSGFKWKITNNKDNITFMSSLVGLRSIDRYNLVMNALTGFDPISVETVVRASFITGKDFVTLTPLTQEQIDALAKLYKNIVLDNNSDYISSESDYLEIYNNIINQNELARIADEEKTRRIKEHNEKEERNKKKAKLREDAREIQKKIYNEALQHGGTGKYGRGYSKQNDPSIGALPYNIRGDTERQTLADSACGPAAAVNVMEFLSAKGKFGRGVSDIIDASNYALDNGYKEINGGTDPRFFADYFRQNGVASTMSTSKDAIAANIAMGNPTILMGQDNAGISSRTPFGKYPHYVTVTGMDSKGNAIVQDPESKYDNLLYDTNTLLNKSSLGVSATGSFGRGEPSTEALSGYTSTADQSNIANIIRSYLLYKGLPENAVYAILGNIYNKTKFLPHYVDPTLLESMRTSGKDFGIKWTDNNLTNSSEIVNAINRNKISKDEFIKPDGKDNTYGYGFLQFARSTDKSYLYDNTVKKGITIASIPGQLDTLLYMINNDKAYAKLKAALYNPSTSIDDISKLLVSEFDNTDFRKYDANVYKDAAKHSKTWQNSLKNKKQIKITSSTFNNEGIENTGGWLGALTRAFDNILDVLWNKTEESTSSTAKSADKPNRELGSTVGLYDETPKAASGKYGRGKRAKFGRGEMQDNAAAIRSILSSKGMPENSIYGILGNMEHESWLRPYTVESLLLQEMRNSSKDFGIKWERNQHKDSKAYADAVDNKTISKDEFLVQSVGDAAGVPGRRGFGLVQFTSKGLKEDLYNRTVAVGKSIADLNAQVNAVVDMINTNSAYKTLKDILFNTQTTVEEAADAFLKLYERPARSAYESSRPKRLAAAEKWKSVLSGQPMAAVPESGSTEVAASDTPGGTAISSGATSTPVGGGFLSKLTSIFDSILDKLNNTDSTQTTQVTPTETITKRELGSTVGLSTPGNTPESQQTATQQPQDGSNKTLPGGGADAQKMVSIARREIDTVESPNNSNKVKYNDWFYGKTGAVAQWCSNFVSWVANQAGVPTSVIPKTGYTPTSYAGILANGGVEVPPKDAMAGDIMYMKDPKRASKDRPYGIYHVGIVEGVTNKGRVKTIEGNTSSSKFPKSGGAVAEKDRNPNGIVVVRPNYKNKDGNVTNQSTLTDSGEIDDIANRYKNTRGTGDIKAFPRLGLFGKGLAPRTMTINTPEGYEKIEVSGEDDYINNQLKANDKNVPKFGKGVITDPTTLTEPKSRITSPFGWRMHPVHHKRKLHKGIDLSPRVNMGGRDPKGTPIKIAADGTVTFAGVSRGYGNRLIVDNGNGYQTTYNHLDSFNGLKVGDTVTGGDNGPILGNTGIGTGSHLHFEVIKNGKHMDPIAGMLEIAGLPKKPGSEGDRSPVKNESMTGDDASLEASMNSPTGESTSNVAAKVNNVPGSNTVSGESLLPENPNKGALDTINKMFNNITGQQDANPLSIINDIFNKNMNGGKPDVGSISSSIGNLIGGDTGNTIGNIGSMFSGLMSGGKPNVSSIGNMIGGLIGGDTGSKISSIGSIFGNLISGGKPDVGSIGNMISGLIGGDTGNTIGNIGSMIGGLIGGDTKGSSEDSIQSMLNKVTNFSTAEQSLPEMSATTQTSTTTTEQSQPVIQQPGQAIDSESLTGILNSLAVIATNTDQLKTIVTILKSKSDINANDFANAQTQNTASSQVGNLTRSVAAKSKYSKGKAPHNMGNIIDEAYSDKLNRDMDDTQSDSLKVIIDKMNTIARE